MQKKMSESDERAQWAYEAHNKPHVVWATAAGTIGGGIGSGFLVGGYDTLEEAVRAMALYSLFYDHRYAWPPLEYEISGHPERDPFLKLKLQEEEENRRYYEEKLNECD